MARLEPKPLSKDPVSGGRETEQFVKRLPHNNEDLSSYPLDLWEKPGVVVHTYTLSPGRGETG